MTRPHEGVVQLGDLIAPATWSTAPILTIRFSTQSFTSTQRQAADNLRNFPNPLTLAFNGKLSEGVNRILGFEHDSASITFYITRT
jgi:hypothetical protein